MADQYITSGGLLAESSVLTALATLAVGVRVYIRIKKRVGCGVDDVFAVISLVLFYGLVFIPTVIGAADAGLGNHVPILPGGTPVPPSYVFDATQFIFVGFQVFPLCAIKLSILFLYRRIFRGPTFDWITKLMIGIVIAWTLSFFLAFLLQCIPITVVPFPGPGEKCINLVPVTEAFTVSGTVTDFCILLIPIPNVWRLQMSVRHKVAISFVFALSFLAVIASIVRCTVMFYVGAIVDAGPVDFSYYDGINLIWEIAEACLGIICASLPVMGHFLTMSIWNTSLTLHSIREALFGRSTSSTSSGGGNGSRNMRLERLGSKGGSSKDESVFENREAVNGMAP